MPIHIATNFELAAPLPLDDRTVADDLSTILAGRRYEGLISYQMTTTSIGGPGPYQLQGGIADANWVPLGGTQVISPPSASLALDSFNNNSPYEKTVDINLDPSFTITVIKRTYDIEQVFLMRNTNVVLTWDTGNPGLTPDGGSVSFTDVDGLDDTSVYKLIVAPVTGDPIESNSITFTYNYPAFWGIGAPGLTGPDLRGLLVEDLTLTDKPVVTTFVP